MRKIADFTDLPRDVLKSRVHKKYIAESALIPSTTWDFETARFYSLS